MGVNSTFYRISSMLVTKTRKNFLHDHDDCNGYDFAAYDDVGDFTHRDPSILLSPFQCQGKCFTHKLIIEFTISNSIYSRLSRPDIVFSQRVAFILSFILFNVI